MAIARIDQRQIIQSVHGSVLKLLFGHSVACSCGLELPRNQVKQGHHCGDDRYTATGGILSPWRHRCHGDAAASVRSALAGVLVGECVADVRPGAVVWRCRQAHHVTHQLVHVHTRQPTHAEGAVALEVCSKQCN